MNKYYHNPINKEFSKEVLFIGDDFGFPAGYSGVARNLFNSLSKRNRALSFGLFSQGSLKKNPPIPHKSFLRSSKKNFKLLFLILDLINSFFVLRKRNIGTIHCLVDIYIPLAYLLSKIFKTKLILTIYGTYTIEPYYSILNPLYKKAFSRALYISSISKYTEKRFYEFWGNLNNVEVVYLGADQNIFKPNIEFSKDKYFLFVGTMKERKGLLPSLQAFQRVLKDRPDYKFYILSEIGFGASSSSDYLKAILEIVNQHPDNILFMDKVSDSRLVELYQRATANVLTSISNKTVFEGFGLIHVEANLCGCLSIGGIDSPNEEIIKEGKNGFLANGRDVDSIERSFRSSIYKVENEDLKLIIRNCVEEGKKFTWDKFTTWSQSKYV
tara:strand:- start:1706 stop:2857 length:1152 start_codon:yes stop_codon:yes gene_type:complete